MDSILFTLNASFYSCPLLFWTVRVVDVSALSARETSRWLCCHLSHLSVFVSAICSATSLTSCLQPVLCKTHGQSSVYPQHLCRMGYWCCWIIWSFFFKISHWHLIQCIYSLTARFQNISLLNFRWHLPFARPFFFKIDAINKSHL